MNSCNRVACAESADGDDCLVAGVVTVVAVDIDNDVVVGTVDAAVAAVDDDAEVMSERPGRSLDDAG